MAIDDIGPSQVFANPVATSWPEAGRIDLPEFSTEVREFGPDQILLDPSVLLGEAGFAWLTSVPREELSRFIIPKTFVDQVAGHAEYSSLDEELWGPLPTGNSLHALAEAINDLTTFSADEAPLNLPFEVLQVVAQLRDFGSEVAVEEWLYLQSNSWIAARSRRLFDHFKRAGAKALEVTGDLLDDVTWLALGSRPRNEPLTASLRARAGVNVVIVGGVATLTVLMPWVGVAGTVAAFFFTPYAKPRSLSTA